MNWKELGGWLANIGLPVLGGAVAGPQGAAVGATIAGKLGLAPGTTADTINSYLYDPAVVVKLKELESSERVRLQELAFANVLNENSTETDQLRIVNDTMVAESKSEHWAQWSWRPFIGFTFGLSILAVASLCCYIAWVAVVSKDMTSINMIPQLVGAFATLFAMPAAVLGVASWWRGKGKVGA